MADPQLDAVLAQLRQIFAGQSGPPQISDMREGARAMARLLDNRDIAVGRIEALTIGGATGDLNARVYTPIAAGAGMQPTLVFFHGGGFICGDLESHDTLCRGLCASSGCRVIAVEYRLAPEHVFPAAVEDAFAALRWIEAQAPVIGVDSNCIAVGGDSAGGNLAAVTCLLAKAAGGPSIRYQLLIYPTTQWEETTASRVEFADDLLVSRPMRDFFTGLYLGPVKSLRDFRAAPLYADDLSGLPPAYIITAGQDPLRDEAVQYAERLRVAGVPVEHVQYDDMIHAFMTMSGALDTAKLAIERAGAALHLALA